MSTAAEPHYSFGEEIANSVTHGAGAVAAIAGVAVLAVEAAQRGGPLHVVATGVFGATLLMLYTASTLYHSVSAPRAKAVLRRLDHIAIYLLIAGTYTPFTLVTLRGRWGWWLFGIIWGCAAVGIILRTTVGARWRILPVCLYVAMGWVVVVAIRPLVATVSMGSLILLVCGGLAYTAGIAFYGWRRLPYSHAIWHLFVLAGSTLHYFAVLLSVIPPSV